MNEGYASKRTNLGKEQGGLRHFGGDQWPAAVADLQAATHQLSEVADPRPRLRPARSRGL